MQGTISFDGTLSGGITGGGGGGSEVTITPTLQSGTKIADFEIDSTPGELYAPTPTPLPEHIVNDIYGFNYTPYPSTEIARYTIDDGVEHSIYVPDYETTWEAYPGVAQDYTIGLLKCYGSTYEVKIPYYQKPLTAGTNITINPVTNVISASGGSSWNYSTTPVNTGQKWIDGKDLYCVVLQQTNIAPDSVSSIVLSNIDMCLCKAINVKQNNTSTSYSPDSISMYNYSGPGTNYVYLTLDESTHDLKFLNGSRVNYCDVTAIVLFTYYS